MASACRRRHPLMALLVVMATAGAAAIDQNRLATLVDEILRKFRVESKMPMFSLAVSVPPGAGAGTYDLDRVRDEHVRKTVLGCEVYAGHDVVAAIRLRWPDVAWHCPRAQVPWEDVLRACGRKPMMTWREVATFCPGAVQDGRTDHAEYRVLLKFADWAAHKEDKSGLLVLYVYAAPCEARCASQNNAASILKLLEAIRGWKDYVVVFSKLLTVKTLREGTSIPAERLTKALRNLGRHLGPDGLAKIFRCDRPDDDDNGAMTCTSCSTGGQVTPHCYRKEGDSEEGNQRGGAPAVGGAPGSAEAGPGGPQGASGAVGRGQGGARGTGGAHGEWQTVGQRRRRPGGGAQGGRRGRGQGGDVAFQGGQTGSGPRRGGQGGGGAVRGRQTGSGPAQGGQGGGGAVRGGQTGSEARRGRQTGSGPRRGGQGGGGAVRGRQTGSGPAQGGQGGGGAVRGRQTGSGPAQGGQGGGGAVRGRQTGSGPAQGGQGGGGAVRGGQTGSEARRGGQTGSEARRGRQTGSGPRRGGRRRG
ncbi:uncharacterized protein LOC109527644 isoform X3 [Hippocampus comes]|uniref:uncharacterized protein LOC109527644 isoform X3 n=1 Tax=Hippocampus comes TaxID=109280 RepID=UPI00094E445E|nr:PREDICTED: uncharacterized protein LOC109527644 isoform X3 [Hippocampus comes]